MVVVVVDVFTIRDGHNRYELTVGRGASDEIVLDISVINRGEDAHESTVTVTLPPQLAFRRSDEQVGYSATSSSTPQNIPFEKACDKLKVTYALFV